KKPPRRRKRLRPQHLHRRLVRPPRRRFPNSRRRTNPACPASSKKLKKKLLVKSKRRRPWGCPPACQLGNVSGFRLLHVDLQNFGRGHGELFADQKSQTCALFDNAFLENPFA